MATVRKYGMFTPAQIGDALTRVAKSATPFLDAALAPGAYHLAVKVQSPIELMFAIAVDAVSMVYWISNESIVFRDFHNLSMVDDESDTSYFLVPQYPMVSNAGNIRVDFMFVNAKTLEPVIAIECDGHDFHERTKEQASRDRSRDRWIQSKSIPIWRFTGSEIFNDPCECVVEILSFLDQ